MTTKSMHQLLEIIEEEVRSTPSAIEFEMAYQARVVVDRIKFATRQVEQYAKPCAQMRDVGLQLPEAVERLQALDRRFQTRPGRTQPFGTGTRENQSHSRRFPHPSAVEGDMIAAIRATTAQCTVETPRESAFPEREMASFAFEKHYRIKELAGIWGLSTKTVTRIFAGEAGVIRVVNNGNGKRKYATLSIPESVALRVHERLGNQSPEAAVATGHALRVIRLGELEGRAPKKKRNVIKVRPVEQPERQIVP